MVAAAHQIGVETNQRAVRLRDEGRIEEARQMLLGNGGILSQQAARYNSKELERYAYDNEFDAQNLDDKNWTRQRKSMREVQHRIQGQQVEK
jgi:Ca-activated chloride channel family protein